MKGADDPVDVDPEDVDPEDVANDVDANDPVDVDPVDAVESFVQIVFPSIKTAVLDVVSTS